MHVQAMLPQDRLRIEGEYAVWTGATEDFSPDGQSYPARLSDIQRSAALGFGTCCRSADQRLDLLAIFRRPFFRLLAVGVRTVEFDVLPKLALGFGRERSGTGFHSGVVLAAI